MSDDRAAEVDRLLDRARRHRRLRRRRRARVAAAVSLGVVCAWAIGVWATGQWGRVADGGAAGLTMVAGSLVAGATPQGGGAVAFPVFTKVLSAPAEVARTFSLCVQAVGMGTAAVAIVITRRPVAWRALRLGVPAALAGFLAGLVVLGEGGLAPAPDAYTKVTFTLIVAAMAFVLFLVYRAPLVERLEVTDPVGRRVTLTLALAGFLGGVASSLVGSGADVLLYVCVVILCGISPRVGVPTSVVAMAVVSVAGFLVLGVGQGHLTGGAAASRGVDMFGLWLAAVPVVAIGAPLGSWLSARATDRQLVRLVVGLAIVEVLTTALFLDELRSDRALLVFAVVGGAGILAALRVLHRHRRCVLGLAGIDLDSPLTRGRVDRLPASDPPAAPITSRAVL